MPDKYEVVISGIGGKFPESDNLDELKKNLFESVNMVTIDDRKWTRGLLGVPCGLGKMKSIDYFDTTFFGIHRKLCDKMDSLNRHCIERTYEAIFDAGINPVELNGSNTAVFMASTISESESFAVYEPTTKDGFGILGHNRSMQANRVSYIFNFTGPSYSLDSTWAGGMEGLHQARQMIADGYVGAALVGVCNLIRHPTISLQFLGMGNLNNDDKVKCFSADADGYSRSEAIVVLLLQRAEEARRSYGTLLHTKTCNFGGRSCFYEQVDGESLKMLLKEIYSEAEIDTTSIGYLEADGSASKKIDAQELNSIVEALCKNRKSPLLVGSVKSNLGHTEAASSLVSIVKALITLDSGRIPPNLHYSSPNPDVPALLSGKIKVVTEEVPLPGDIVGVTTLGVSGSYGHAILKRYNKQKQRMITKDTLPPDGLPRLIVISGRNVTGLLDIIKQLEEAPLDEEFAALMHKVFFKPIALHMVRGYVILPKLETSESDYHPVLESKELPVWFVFSGMGSQWLGMGSELLQIPIFAAAIDKCQAALTSKGINVREIITNTSPGFLDNIIYSFVGIAAIQIGLVDILFSLGIKPNGIVGHSLGELGCAYADGCFTAEEMIQCAYARGQASIETELIEGMMAAVGKGYAQIKDELPKSIEVACHNSSESCTLSGPTSDMKKYIGQLKESGVFAKLVNVSNIAYHSRYITPAAPKLLQYLQEVIKEPKPRSERWISSSILKDHWDTSLAQTSSPEYHTNNLLSSVYFEEACRNIPNEAIIIEIAPHGLLQAILRRSHKLCINIPLTQKNSKDAVRFLLSAIGKMFMAGMQPNISQLYPPVEFPVSCGTPSLQPFVTWDHSELWPFGNMNRILGLVKAERQVSIDINNPNEQFFENHKIFGRVIVPVSMYLFMAWETLLNIHKEQTFSKRVVFQNVRFFRSVELTNSGPTKLYILVQKGSGNFEVCLGRVLVASGSIHFMEDIANDLNPNDAPPTDESVSSVFYSAHEVYTMIDGLGYEHRGNFRNIECIQISKKGLSGRIKWNKNWVMFLDSLIKASLFTENDCPNSLLVPSFIHKLYIDPTVDEDLTTVNLTYDSINKTMWGTGMKLKMIGVEHSNCELVPLHTTGLKVEEYKFIPHINPGVEDLNILINICLQIILESSFCLSCADDKARFMIIKISKEEKDQTLSSLMERYCKTLLSESITTFFGTPDDMYDVTEDNHSHLIIADNPAQLDEAVTLLEIKNKSFILTYVSKNSTIPSQYNLTTIMQQQIENKKIVLLKKVSKVCDEMCYIVHSSTQNWTEELTNGLRTISEKEEEAGTGVVYFVIHEEPLSGVTGFVNRVSSIGDIKYLRFVFLLDKCVPAFSPSAPFYKAQLSQDLNVNVYKDGDWGSFRYFPIVNSISPNPVHLEEPTTHLTTLSLDGMDVKYLGLNLRDLTISKRKKGKCELGHLEYAGVTRDGKRVMGLVQFEATATRLCPDPYLSWPVPSHWSLEDAATVPLPYTIAYYALVVTAQAAENERVLIHAGYSAVGQAAIAIGLHIGCRIFTTFSSKEQEVFLKKRFPQLLDPQIKSYENERFDVDFLFETNGEGFSVILNCLEGKKLHASMCCLGQNGRFIQLGHTDLQKKSKLGMFMFLKSTSVFGSSADHLFSFPDDKKNELNYAVVEGIRSGVVQPLDRKVLTGPCTGEEALKTLESVACGNHGGRVVLALEGEKSHKIAKDVNGKYSCDPDKTYLIIGGKSGMWVELVEWLAIRGARKLLVAVAKHAMSSNTAFRFNLLLMRYNSASIHLVSAYRADSQKEAIKLLMEASAMGPLAAIFFLVINDNSNKVANLDWASRKVITTNPHFVCILSGSVQICESRRTDGLQALAVLWGKPFSKPSRIILAMDHLLVKEPTSPVIFLSEHNLTKKIENEIVTNQNIFHIPTTLNGLIQLGQQASDTYFVEVTTKSLRYKDTKGVATVFVIPGLIPGQVDGLVSNLVYPTFKAVFPQAIASIRDIATSLFKVLERDFNHLQMFNLLAETWGGAIAISLAGLLETAGKQATLLLVDGSPDTTKTILQPIFENMDGQLIKHYFGAKVFQGLSSIVDWNERLEKVLFNCNQKKEIKHGFTALRSRLQALFNLELPEVPIGCKIHLFRPKGALENDNCNLNLYCSKSITTYVYSDMDLKQMIDSNSLSETINKLVYYEYSDAAIEMTDELAVLEVALNSNRNLGMV